MTGQSYRTWRHYRTAGSSSEIVRNYIGRPDTTVKIFHSASTQPATCDLAMST